MLMYIFPAILAQEGENRQAPRRQGRREEAPEGSGRELGSHDRRQAEREAGAGPPEHGAGRAGREGGDMIK